MTSSALAAWLGLLPILGLNRGDLGVRPERWDTRLTDPQVERILADPLSAPETLDRWEKAMEPGSDLLRAAAEALPRGKVSAPPMPDEELSCDSLPPGLDLPLSSLSAKLEVIERQLKAALPSPDSRVRLNARLTPLLTGEPQPTLDAALFDEAGRFDAGRAAALAADADSAVRAALGPVRAALVDAPDRKIRCGDLLVGSSRDDDYSQTELEGAALIVDLGGRNRYKGPAAAAGPGQVRVIVDLGHDAVFESTGPAAGSGRFGIGLLYALGSGTTTIKAGDFSAGAGFFGAGAAFIEGPAVLETGAFSQGAGAFGSGALELRGAASAKATLAAQGFGFTRGVGLFAARGKLEASCGLKFPDPREPLAWLSLCQGTGYGPRAYAAGGWGVARVDGAGSTLESSYFAQGSGYWRSGGLLSVFGDGTVLQARRYSQGAGVHTAVGALRLRARAVHTGTWGVGPGYGWDYGVGVLDAEGDRLYFQNDWSGGRADANGRSLVHVAGSGAVYSVHGLSYGAFSRAAPSWSLVALEGYGHRLRAPGLSAEAATSLLRQTPYGALSVSTGTVTLDPALGVNALNWPSGDRTWAVARERRELEDRLARAQAMTAKDRTRELLFIVSQFGLDPQQVGRAIDELSKTSAAEAPDLVAALDPARFDEFIWIRLLSAALGRPAGWAAANALKDEKGLRRSLLVGLLRTAPIDVAVAPALAELKSPDWRSRREAVGVLASVLDASRGEEPGRLAFLEDSLAYLKDGDEAKLIRLAGVKRLSDLYGALALAERLPLSDRVALLQLAASPFDAVGEPALKKYAALIKASEAAVKKSFEAELTAARKASGRARSALTAAVNDPEPEVAAAALVSLGGLATVSDASTIAKSLGSPSAPLRLAAANGLARLGPAASAALASALDSKDANVRAAAAQAAGRSWDGDLLVWTLKRALADPDESVRLAALSSISTVQTPLLDRRKDLKDDLARLAEKAGAPERAAALARLAELPK